MTKFSPSDVTILLLDSDSVMRAALHDAFQSAGYLVVTARDLGEAVDRLDEVRPDLLGSLVRTSTACVRAYRSQLSA